MEPLFDLICFRTWRFDFVKDISYDCQSYDSLWGSFYHVRRIYCKSECDFWLERSYAFTSKREGEGCTGVLVKNSGKMGDNGENKKKKRCYAVLMERACLFAPPGSVFS